MRWVAAGWLFAALFVGVAGCSRNGASAGSNQPPSADAQIRAAIQARLAQNTNLNLQAFDTDVKQVTVDGDHAQAQVDFRLKNGPGVMQLTYQLEKRDGNWTIVDSNPTNSNFSHPSLDQSQAPSADAPAGASHSLSDTLRSFKSGAGATGAPADSLPPGHPPISGSSSVTQQ